MADSAFAPGKTAVFPALPKSSRHPLFVRATHWITAACFAALLVSGCEIVVSHPRFYWGETGNAMTKPLFKIPIPASRATVPTGYGYVLPDQNGWSRALHFQTAWILILTGGIYLLLGSAGYFKRSLLPAESELSLRALGAIAASHARFRRVDASPQGSYNALQKLTYLLVIFFLFPLVIWTGLAMSPGFVAAFPATVTLLGGQQTARTIHFFLTLALSLFLAVHVVMVARAGFADRVWAMITGNAVADRRNP